MNINTIIVISFIFISTIIIICILYSRANAKKQEKLAMLRKKKDDNEVIRYMPQAPEKKKSPSTKKMMIKKDKGTSLDKDIISEAISELSELSDFEAMKNRLQNGIQNNKGMRLERDTSNYNILFVDDSPVFLKTAKKTILESGENYSVTTACDGIDALSKLKNFGIEFDLIITDMDMPRMNGAELIKEVKDDVILSKLPIIVVTAQPRLLTFGLERKIIGVLEKPYEHEDLLYQIKSSLQ